MKSTIRTNTDKEAFLTYVKGKEIDSAYRAEFSKIRRKRSLNANAYFWLILTIGMAETGNDKDDLYYYFMNKYPTTKEVEISDEIHLVSITSSAFNTAQMATLTDHIRREFSMMGISTPDADSDKLMDVYNYYHDRNLV
ncbi:MAG TPA: hypothetical protein ENH82_08215 [bacterium]|nr:hypothetical protein [bacterium]